MHDSILFENLEIVGTTTVTEDLPRRLSPVYRERRAAGLYYFTVAEDGAPSPVLSVEPGEHFDAMVATGDAARFDQPVPARAGYCLLQVETGAPPEYCSAHDVPTRLFRACREALERASRALSEGKRDEAERFLWYARRADADDPLALLALQGLLRHEVLAEDLHFLEIDMETYPASLIEAARRRAREKAELSAIGELLDEPFRSTVRLAHISSYRSNPSFLPDARRYKAVAPRRNCHA